MSQNRIKGGYCILARCIDESEIAAASPCTRELWNWLIRKANWSDGKKLKRGQVLTTYNDISDALSWKVGFRVSRYSMHEIEAAMKTIRRLSMVTTTKTTQGMLITICNYDKYQNPNNYEDHNEDHNEDHTKTTLYQKNKRIEELIKKEKDIVPPPSEDEDDLDGKKEKRGKRKIRAYDEKSKPYLLAKFLFEEIDNWGYQWPKGKYPDLQKWADQMRLLIENDNMNGERDPRNVCKVIRFATRDTRFWQDKILTPENLRDKWGKLVAEMNKQAAKSTADLPPVIVLCKCGAAINLRQTRICGKCDTQYPKTLDEYLAKRMEKTG